MKKVLLSLPIMGLLVSCSQLCQIQIEPLKDCVADKSIALPATPAISPMENASPMTYGLIGAAFLNSSPNYNSFLSHFKDHLRRKGWKIVVSGITGRGGNNNSINAGASFTLVGVEGSDYVNLSVVENKTGEEVLLIKGRTWWEVEDKARRCAEKLDELVK